MLKTISVTVETSTTSTIKLTDALTAEILSEAGCTSLSELDKDYDSREIAKMVATIEKRAPELFEYSDTKSYITDVSSSLD